MTFAMIILRKQWADREKLVYPLVQVPMEMIQQQRKGIIGKSFFTNKSMWVAFAFSFMLISINGLHSYSPSFPSIERDFRLPIFRDTVTLWFFFSPSWLGLLLFCRSRYFRVHLGFPHPHPDSEGHLQRRWHPEHGADRPLRSRYVHLPSGHGGDDRLRADHVMGDARTPRRCIPQGTWTRTRNRRLR